MPAIKLEQFGGQLPAWEPHLLPMGQAAASDNTYLFSGGLEGWRKPTLLRALLNSAARYVYRVPTISETQSVAYLIGLVLPQEGDTITVSELTYKFTAAVTNINDVLIGPDLETSLQYLLQALTYDFGEGTNVGVHYGVGTLANSDVLAYPPGVPPQTGLPGPQVGFVAISGTIYPYMQIGSTDFGAAFNTIEVGESTAGVRLTWLKDLLALSDTTSTYAGGSNPNFVNAIDGPATWLEYLDQDTDVVKSQVVDDSFNRYYVASPSQEPAYNTYDRITLGKPAWKLGIPAPGCAPTVAVSDGGSAETFGNTAASAGSQTSVALQGNFIYLTPTTPTSTGVANDVQLSYSPTVSPGPYQNFFGTFGFVVYDYFGALPPGVTVGEQPDGSFINLITQPGTYGIRYDLDTGVASQAVIINSDGSLGFIDNSVQWAAVIYADDNGAPGDIVGIGAVVTGLNSTITNVSVFSNPPTLQANTQYWIGVMTSGPANVAGVTNGTPGVGFPNTFTNGPPSSAPPAADLIATPQAFTMFIDFGSVTDVVEARSYVYTWVSAYNEEGPPSPPTLANGWSNGNWTIGLFTPPALDVGVDRNLAIARLYRTVVGVGGSTVYFWVADISLDNQDADAQAMYANNPLQAAMFQDGVQSTLAEGIYPSTSLVSFLDQNTDNLVAQANQLPSTNWFPPPENMEALITMPNGMMAGFKDNEVWFCEPYLPHAWPPGYVVTTDFPIVGLGLAGGALVATTAAKPYVFNGVSPGNLSSLIGSSAEPCISKGSVLSGDSACTYMSPNGLIQVNAQAEVVNTTDLWITRERWQELTPQKFPHAIYLASCYYAFGTTSPAPVVPADNSEAQEGFTIELDQDNASFSIWPQPGGHRLGFNSLMAPNAINVDNVLMDPWTGIGMLIQGGNVYYFNFADPAPAMQTYTWRSKIYQQNVKKSYAAMKVFFTVPTNTPALNPVRQELPVDDPAWQELGANQYAILRTYADPATEDNTTGAMVLVDCREVRKSGELLRIVSGFKAENWQWEITGRVLISNVQIATSAKELANV